MRPASALHDSDLKQNGIKPEVENLYIVLLLVSVIMLAGVILNGLSGKIGVPALLAFIVLGMIFGSDGIAKIPFDNFTFAEQICTAALIFIMFYGGFGTNIHAARPIAAQALILSSLGVVLTAGLVGLFCHFCLGLELIDSFLIGSVISSTDAASVFSVLRSKRLNLKYNTASILEVESGSNDPFSYMLTVILLSIKSGEISGAGSVLYMLFAQLVYGAVFGVLIGLGSAAFLKRFKFKSSGVDNMFVVAVVLLSYALPGAVGGNGFLSAYIVGIILGTADINNKRSLVPFFDGVTSIMQLCIFFLLGLLSFPSRLPSVMFISLGVALFLTFIARPVVVFGLLAPFRCKISQMLVISWSGLRGAASIVFAVMAMMQGTSIDIYHIVFGVVLFSILIQGTLIPPLSKKLNMIDNKEDVMKTFNDYSDEIPIQFIQFAVTDDHPWSGLEIKDIVNPPDTILVLILRGDEKIVPNGSTRLRTGDVIILSAKSPDRIPGIRLSEKTISKESTWIGKPISKLPNTSTRLIIMINRDGEAIIPNGDTVIRENDVLVINHSD